MKPYYQDSAVTIYHGDCREIAPLLAAGAVVSDPPYGMDWDTNTTRFSGGNNPDVRLAGRNDRRAVAGDAEPFDPSPWLAYEHVILWGFHHFAARLPVGSCLVWIKRLDHAFGSFLSDAETAWKKGGYGVYCHRDLSMNALTASRAHPTQKPVGLMQWCLGFIPPDLTILDPYMGSGTTLVAAKNLGRQATGVELEERYCETAARRLSQEVLDLGAA